MSDRDASLDEASNIAFKALKEKPPAKPVDLYLFFIFFNFECRKKDYLFHKLGFVGMIM